MASGLPAGWLALLPLLAALAVCVAAREEVTGSAHAVEGAHEDLVGSAAGSSSLRMSASAVAPAQEKAIDEDEQPPEEGDNEVEEEMVKLMGIPWKGWAWVALICYMFYAQEHVCEAYFVSAIDVYVEIMKAKGSPWGQESVAGATICALGCNGPELFTNIIATCVMGGSDVGVGTIVGSEIFNLLIIIGGAVLASPILPMPIDSTTFTRDCGFYALSIALLAWTLADGIVQWYESGILLFLSVVYTAAVYYTSKIEVCLGLASPEEEEEPEALADATMRTPSGSETKIHGVIVDVRQILQNRMADSKCHHKEREFFDAQPRGLYVKAQEEKKDPLKEGLAAVGLNKTRRSVAAPSYGVHLGESLMGGTATTLPYKFLTEIIVTSKVTMRLRFQPSFFEETTLELTMKDEATRKELLTKIENFAKDKQKVWTHDYDPTPVGILKHLGHTLVDSRQSCFSKFFSVVALPVELVLAGTLFMVDVKDLKKEGRWLGCFVGAMAWLGIFSYIMVAAAGAINYYFGVPESVLGITLCALGTSFPNAVASILMAKQGKTPLAISNALGSNVQNIFLALAFPWVLVTVFPILDSQWFRPFPMPAPGIKEGVAWMLGTLVLVLAFVAAGRCSLGKCSGWVCILAYIVYIVKACSEALSG